MEVYKLNRHRTLPDNKIELMIGYLGKIDWKKYRGLIKKLGLRMFDTDALLRYDNYTSKEILYIHEACRNNDGASAETFCILLYKLHQKYPKESMSLYKTNPKYKETIDKLLIYFESNLKEEP